MNWIVFDKRTEKKNYSSESGEPVQDRKEDQKKWCQLNQFTEILTECLYIYMP